MITLKVTKNQGFTLSLENKFLEKQQRGVTLWGGQIDPPPPPNLFRVKTAVLVLLVLWTVDFEKE